MQSQAKKPIRVRFAPSPTGALHVGGARTAIFNWLYARSKSGKFILRIEDTDKSRSTGEAIRTILQGLEWLGLDWDEGPNVGGNFGPYHQAERLHIYQEHALKLYRSGKTYKCYCTPEELDAMRKAQEKRKEAPRYDGRCKNLSRAQLEKFGMEGKPCVFRFKIPETGTTVIDDLVKGKVEFKNELLDDFVILKSDGFPTYNFAAAVDDNLMEISHVIRGEDHLSNTPKQILIYQAFGFPLPAFAHIPMILGKDRSKLSKRHGATAVTEYEKQGYLPEAMLNYLARLGWGYGDEEIFSREDLIKKFSLDRVVKTPAIFDTEKLDWLNGHYIRKSLPERIADLAEPFLMEAYPDIKKMETEKTGLNYVIRVVKCLQDRLRVIPDIVPLSEFFFKDVSEYEKAAAEKHFKDPNVSETLNKLKEKLSALKNFDHQSIEGAFKGLAEELKVKLGIIIHPARLALTGRKVSPGIYEVVEILGKEKVVARLERALDYLKTKD